MAEASPAEEHLRVIRSLMERATIYRAISAQAALVGGVLSGVAAAFTAHPTFLLPWAAVFAVASVVNFIFLQREASRRGAPLFSAGMKLALGAMAPPLLLGLVFTLLFRNSSPFLVAFWLLSYGLALLATAHFSPRSLTWLGWAFLLTGLGYASLTVSGLAYELPATFLRLGLPSPSLIMGLTFGAYHLLYALCTWPRRA